MMDIYDKYIIDIAESMNYFAGDDKTLNIGKWKKWRNACLKSYRVIDPKEFK